MRSKPALFYSLLFFISGATGLIYELLWVRVLYQSFGSTIQSVTTVVAAYMGGLGLGAWLFGRVADRWSRPARLYGWLEIAIGFFGILSPLMLGLAHRLYIGTAGSLELGGGSSMALRFGLAALVLLIPTTLMGGTLPVLTRAFMGEDRDLLKPSLGRLYGLNTLGAVFGTALAGFFLIEYIGVRASLWATAALNLAIGAIAIGLSREVGSTDPGRQLWDHAVPSRDGLTRIAMVLLALTAFASLLSEIAWTRVLVMIIGGSTYAFTLVLLVFLLGIGLGSVLIARMRPTSLRADTAAFAALAQGISGVGGAALFVFFGLLPAYIIAVFQIAGLPAIIRLVLMGIATGAVILVPALGMGMTFPLLTDLVAGQRGARGADVGKAYALNTLGSILGAVVTGFVLVTVLGTQLTLRVGVAISGLAALLLALWVSRGVTEGSEADRRIRVRVLMAAGLGVIALVIAVVGRGWNTRLIDLGPTIYARQQMDATARRLFLAHQGVRQLAFREGRNATVSVWEGESGRSLRVNGKVDASDRGDMDTQVMLGLAPAVARSNAASAFVIGYGSGVTARVLAAVPTMTRVRIVEIEPAVLQMDSLFHRVNDTVLRRPGVEPVVDDARSALQLDRERYDIIVSEPSNPWIAGIATLYTPEFFRIVRGRLKDDGVFAQWVQLYQLPLPIVAGIVRNMRAEFPHVEVWFGEPADLIVLASPHPITFDSLWVRRLLGGGPNGALSELAREWLAVDTPEQYFGFRLLGERGVKQLVARATFEHSDNRPRLEFAAARSFLEYSGTVTATFDTLAQLGASEGDEAVSPLLLRNVAMRRRDAGALPYVELLRRAEPNAGEFAVREAGLRLGLRDTVTARLLLAGVYARGRAAGRAWGDAMLLGGVIATATHEPRQRAIGFLEAALSAGADTAQARAALALWAVRDARWVDAATQARASLARARGTFRHPYPAQFLAEALMRLALEGPPALADSVLRFAVERRPGSARYRELAAVAALRAGHCDDAAAGFVELLDFAVEREDGPALVRDCRNQTGAIERSPAAGSSAGPP